ncbi:hypothetical protein ASS64_03520 [Erythrobacter sp. AP23]|nr:hypothetical protein ASS64_03520 [Erythrobacter sp. AP23]
MIHRTEFELRAISKDLFAQFIAQDFNPRSQPFFRFLALKKEAGENQCFGVCKEVIAQKMPFKSLSQPACLN